MYTLDKIYIIHTRTSSHVYTNPVSYILVEDFCNCRETVILMFTGKFKEKTNRHKIEKVCK